MYLTPYQTQGFEPRWGLHIIFDRKPLNNLWFLWRSLLTHTWILHSLIHKRRLTPWSSGYQVSWLLFLPRVVPNCFTLRGGRFASTLHTHNGQFTHIPTLGRGVEPADRRGRPWLPKMLDPLPQLLRDQCERLVKALSRLKGRLFFVWSGGFKSDRRDCDEPRELVVIGVGK